MTINKNSTKTKIKFREVCVKNLIYNSKETQKRNRTEQKLCGTIQNSGRYNEICYNKSDIFGVMVDFTFTADAFCVFFSLLRCVYGPRFASQFGWYQCQHLYFMEGLEKMNIIYRLADCTCLSFTYMKIPFPM